MLRTVLLALALALPPSAVSAQRYFDGDPCTVDCSGHQAGYEWAEQHDITDPDECGGNSNSFIEGCQAWAEEQADEQAEEEADQQEDEDVDPSDPDE